MDNGKKSVTVFLVFLLISSLIGWVLFSKATVTSVRQPDTIIAIVGEENIYQKDLDYEVQQHPSAARNSELTQALTDKLVEDSIILQGSKQDNLITLNEDIFNSPNKDYKKRVDAVMDLKDLINQRSDNVSGEIITVWFYNNELGALPYDKAKALAKTKIDEIYKLVVAGSLTMKGAAEKLKLDPDIKLLDPKAYQSNLYLEFNNKQAKDKISFDAAFDQAIRDTQVSKYTPVMVLKGIPGMMENKELEIVYAFAYVHERNKNESVKDFDTWLNNKKGQLKVEYQ